MALQSYTDRVLRYSDCYRYLQHALAGDLAVELNPKDVVDQAGEHLVNMHEWKWLEVRSAQLELRPKVTVENATFTAATKTLTLAGAFTNYTFVDGDTFQPTAGTAVRLASVKVASKTSANAIVLAEDITTDASNPTDVAGNLPNNLVALPDPIRDARSISATDAVINGLQWTTPEDLLRKRTAQVDVSSSWNYYGFATYAGDPPRPVLEVWPTTTNADPKAFTMFYRVGWQAGDTDTDTVKMPPFMNACFLSLVRIFAIGWEEGFEAGKPSLPQLLMDFERSPLLMAAKRRDGLLQPTMGPLRGGAVQSMVYHSRALLSSEVDAPT